MSFPNLAAALPHVKGGTLRALAITSQRRSSLLPEVPTLDEVGLKGFEFTQWQTVLAPAGTPPEVIARLNRALNSAIESKDLREKFQAQAMEPFIATPEETRKFLAGELARYTRIIKSRKITAE